MTSAIRGRGAAFDVSPTDEQAFGIGGPLGGIVGFITDATRGACSGLLALMGGAHITGTASTITPQGSGLSYLTSILEQFSYSGIAGPVEVLGGIALFLTARRVLARTLGLLLFIGLLAGYANGYSLADMLGILSTALQAAAGFLETTAAQTA